MKSKRKLKKQTDTKPKTEVRPESSATDVEKKRRNGCGNRLFLWGKLRFSKATPIPVNPTSLWRSQHI